MLILGCGKLAVDLSRIISTRKGWTEIIGFVGEDERRVGERLDGAPILGTYDKLFEIVESYSVHKIAVCLDDRRATLPIQTLLDFKVSGREVIDGHSLYETEAGRLSIDLLRPSALVFSAGFRRRAIEMALKRLMDVVVSAVGLALLMPVFLLIGSMIKLDSVGPVFYRQIRVGFRGHPYMIWKFRSMSMDAEKHGPRWADVNDSRVSRVGRWLRKLRIDELPQLINVLKGEMSLVGPRPERPVFVQEFRSRIPYYDLRHTVRPGITGWAQIKFRYGASQEDSHTKLQYDLYYVKNLSVWLDLRVLSETFRVVMLGEGAR